MNSSTSFRAAAALAGLAAVAILVARLKADDPPGNSLTDTIAAARRVQPQPFTRTVDRGLDYLVSQQHANGGWGQGGGWRQNSQRSGRVDGENVNDPPDLGNTCIATLALVRAGNTPRTGPYAQNVARAVAHLCEYIERSDDDSLYATDVRDTQLQSKIGRYVDTFLAGLVLSELKGKMPADGSDKRVLAALEKTVRKIEKNQQADGNFNGNSGWASVLSQAVCSKFINRAAQAEVAVRSEVLDRDFRGTVALLDRDTGKFVGEASRPAARARIEGAVPALAVTEKAASAPSDAGVSLYLSASNASRLSDQGNTTFVVELRARQVLANKAATDEEKRNAEADLKRVDDVRDAQKLAMRGIIEQLDDKGFIAGFGNNGGEEFLSYMNISEMLVVQGGNEWDKWNKSIAANLGRVQNEDGSWSGQHCITGRTFCTATALLTLLADRAPVPLAANDASQPNNK